MSKINTEFFLARRISSRGAGTKNVMVRIATVTVAVSVAVMIVSLAVIFGFRHEITQKLTGFAGHVEIMNLDSNSSYETQPVQRNAELEQSIRGVANFKSLFPYAIKGGIIKTDEAMQGVMLKGVDSTYDWSFFSRSMVEGDLPHTVDTVRTIIISRTISDLLKIGVGDRAEMLFVQADRPPRRALFKISGIYKTGLAEMDKVMVLTDIRTVQRLNRWDADQVTGYEVNTTDFDALEKFEDDIYTLVVQNRTADGQRIMAISVKEKYPNLFDWLGAHNVNAAIIISIMLLVALLNMISALLIILLERTRMIGELKAMGMSNRSLRKMFVIRSSFIVLKGMLWGNVFGIGLCLLQKYTHVVKLNETGYFISEVPIQLGAWWLLALNAGTFILLVLLLVIPTTIVSRIRPDKTIRYS